MIRGSHLFLLLALIAPAALPAQKPAPAREPKQIDTSDSAPSPDAWESLRAVRSDLAEAGTLQANFTQTYVPAGFTSGEKESGKLALALPDCLRWDYTDPYPKSFLLCGGNAWVWNPQDKTGRRYAVDRKTEPGLDLLLLGVDDLKNRYKAAARPLDGGRTEISLSPKAKISPIKDAILVVEGKGAAGDRRLVQVSYRDSEGNQTRFDLADYREIARKGTTFSPPTGIKWEDER
ncbi:MAG TPA: outer membrane lipoprotein carrier protein LolA [Thermoanaerobaculia bacterium]|nr:outer membrane lipoprotein carrier protein LolA [Thermoanaerobaculia bacterium]